MNEIYENSLNFLMDFISIKTFIAIIVIYFLIIWIALIIWVIKDINSRSESILLKIFSIFIVIFFGLFGALFYLLIRPSKTYFERYYEEVEGNIDCLTENILNKLKKKKDLKELKIKEIKKSKPKKKSKKITSKNKEIKKSK